MTDPFEVADLILRDRYDRPMIVPPEGGDAVPYTRASTFCSALTDSSGIAKWKARHIALAMGRHEDLAAMAAGEEYGSKDLDAIIETAIDRSGCNSKANYGTAVHTFTEPAQPMHAHVPNRMQADVQAYYDTLTRTGITTVAAERFVVCDEIRAAGTFDHIYAVPSELLPTTTYGMPPDHHVSVVGDVKTGKLHFTEHAVQLAIYSRGKLYDPQTGERTDLGVSHDWGLLVHVPAGEGTATLYWVDLNAGWAAADLAAQVRIWRERKDLAVPLDDIEARLAESVEAAKPAPERGCSRCTHDAHTCGGCGAPLQHGEVVCFRCKEDDADQKLCDAIGKAVSEAALEALWRARKDIWTEEHTRLARAKRELIKGGVK